MKILAIDTSGQTASAALIEDEKLIGEFTQNDKLTHSQTILPMVAEICEKQIQTRKMWIILPALWAPALSQGCASALQRQKVFVWD